MRGVADFGGDTRVRATFTNGDTQNIRGNEGFYRCGELQLLSASRAR
jgi:hypothetical protein